MADSDTQAEQPKQRRFKVHLIQTVPEHEVVAETFEYAVDNKKLALEQAQNFLDDEKDLGDTQYRLEAEEIKDEPSSEPLTPADEANAELDRQRAADREAALDQPE